VSCHDTLESVTSELDTLTGSRDPAVLLLSDQLAIATQEPFPAPKHRPTEEAEHLIKEHKEDVFGTIALLERNDSVAEIDHVLWSSFDSAAVLEVLQLAAERLMYIRTPKKDLFLKRPVVIRQIDGPAELAEYFRLRHRVYRIMGYLLSPADLTHRIWSWRI